MGFPKTMIGIIGFILVTGYVISLVIDEKSQNTQLESMVSHLQNATAAEDTTYFGINLGFLSIAGNLISMFWNTILILLSSVTTFMQIPGERGLPAETYIFFVLIFIGAAIAIIKLLWSGE